MLGVKILGKQRLWLFLTTDFAKPHGGCLTLCFRLNMYTNGRQRERRGKNVYTHIYIYVWEGFFFAWMFKCRSLRVRQRAGSAGDSALLSTVSALRWEKSQRATYWTSPGWADNKIKIIRIKKKKPSCRHLLFIQSHFARTLSPDQNNEKPKSLYWIKASGKNQQVFFFSAAVSQTDVLDLV